MADYRRMEWQYWANRVAEAVEIGLVVLMAEEVVFAIRYHFPWWDDIAMPVTTLLWWIAGFVERHTRMYRIDL